MARVKITSKKTLAAWKLAAKRRGPDRESPVAVEWEYNFKWGMSGCAMRTRKALGTFGTKASPWLVVEQASSAQVGLEFTGCTGGIIQTFEGVVVTLPKGYKGALKLGMSVQFSADHVLNPQ